MADLRVFVSSTCYDLAVLREQLRLFLQGAGHQPVMSDYSDVLYDHRNHTHTSCVKEVSGCDIAIVIIGGRFGGAAVPEAISQIAFDNLRSGNSSPWILDHCENVSITQVEVLRAIQDNIPVFAFIEDQVWHDHQVYEKNKSSSVGPQIVFPSIDKPETAKYVFEFINFLRHRAQNNSIQRFSRLEDIVSHLRRQWSALFQRLLLEQRQVAREVRSTAQITEQLESLKAAVLSSIKEPGVRDIARGAVRFRHIVDFVLGLHLDNPREAVRCGETFENLLRLAHVSRAAEVLRSDDARALRTLLIKSDGTILMMRSHVRILRGLRSQWTEFNKLPVEARTAILEAWEDMGHVPPTYVLSQKTFEEWVAEGTVLEITLDQVFSESDEPGTAA